MKIENVKNLAILGQYYLLLIAGTFKTTKSKQKKKSRTNTKSGATQGHAVVFDG
jgi:hypothetical protein